MRNISEKTDGVSTLPASDFNANLREELQNAVTSADITLDPEGGPDTDTDMLQQTLTAYSNASQQYQDSGTANAYTLTMIVTTFGKPAKYYDGMKVIFKAGNTNTGASTINIETIGVKDLKNEDGTALTGGQIRAGAYIVAIYNLGADRFEIDNISGKIIENLIMALNKGLDFSANSIGIFKGIESIVYRLNTTITNDDNPLGQTGGEWEAADDTDPESNLTASINSLIKADTPGNGEFQFQKTGWYLIQFHSYCTNASGGNTVQITMSIDNNGAGYNSIAHIDHSMYDAGGGAANTSSMFSLVKISGTATNYKLKLIYTTAQATGSIVGSTTRNTTAIAFIRLADE